MYAQASKSKQKDLHERLTIMEKTNPEEFLEHLAHFCDTFLYLTRESS